MNDSAALAAECARKLLELRADTGETQQQLAGRLGMTESMISRLESSRHVPSLKTLCRIADVFGRQLEIVFHEHEHAHANGVLHSHIHTTADPDHEHVHIEGDIGTSHPINAPAELAGPATEPKMQEVRL